LHVGSASGVPGPASRIRPIFGEYYGDPGKIVERRARVVPLTRDEHR
jgi:hypothetical protein